jgi:hypothetical protein
MAGGGDCFSPSTWEAAGAFRDVVVYLESIEKGKSFSHAPTPRIEAKDCQFIPFMTVVHEKQDVSW